MEQDEKPSTHGFGTRLRRLVERLDRDVQALYRDAGSNFEPRWYAVFTALLEHGPATVGDLAQRLDVTHAAVSQVRSALLAEGLITTRADPGDGRRTTLVVTPKGAAVAIGLRPLWRAINAATAEVLANEAPGLLGGLHDLGEALTRRSMKSRVEDLLSTDPE